MSENQLSNAFNKMLSGESDFAYGVVPWCGPILLTRDENAKLFKEHAPIGAHAKAFEGQASHESGIIRAPMFSISELETLCAEHPNQEEFEEAFKCLYQKKLAVGDIGIITKNDEPELSNITLN